MKKTDDEKKTDFCFCSFSKSNQFQAFQNNTFLKEMKKGLSFFSSFFLLLLLSSISLWFSFLFTFSLFFAFVFSFVLFSFFPSFSINNLSGRCWTTIRQREELIVSELRFIEALRLEELEFSSPQLTTTRYKRKRHRTKKMEKERKALFC